MLEVEKSANTPGNAEDGADTGRKGGRGKLKCGRCFNGATGRQRAGIEERGGDDYFFAVGGDVTYIASPLWLRLDSR